MDHGVFSTEKYSFLQIVRFFLKNIKYKWKYPGIGI